MCATVANSKFVNLTNLELKLIEIEGKVFADAEAKQQDDLNRARRAMFDQIGHTRFEDGLAVRSYHNFYIQSKERAWTEEAGPLVMRRLGVGSLKSIYNLMDDLEFAEDHLTEDWLKALIRSGIDPAAHKNQEFIVQFKDKLTEKPAPKSATDREMAALAEFKKFRDRKKKPREKKEPSADDKKAFRSAIANRMARFLLVLPESERQPFVDGIAPEVWAILNTLLEREATKADSGARSLKPVRTRKASHASGSSPSQPSTAEKRAMPIRPEPRPTLVKSKPASQTAPPLPWGDTCLNTLEILEPGLEGSKQARFHRELVYQVRSIRKPTRYLVGGLLDLFDPGVEEKYLDEHLDVFKEAYWHTFLVMTPHVERVRRQWNRRKTITNGLGFPPNLWIGTTIECPDNLERLRALHGAGIVPLWVSFARYRSDRSRFLSTSTLMKDLEDCAPRLVVIGWDLANPRQDLSIEDACTLANAAARFAPTPFFHTHPESRSRFLHGQAPASATKPVIQDRDSAELIEWAEQLHDLPESWFRMPFPPKNIEFAEFKGDPVEDFDYKPDTSSTATGLKSTS